MSSVIKYIYKNKNGIKSINGQLSHWIGNHYINWPMGC